jgi:hypothetical protein
MTRTDWDAPLYAAPISPPASSRRRAWLPCRTLSCAGGAWPPIILWRSARPRITPACAKASGHCLQTVAAAGPRPRSSKPAACSSGGALPPTIARADSFSVRPPWRPVTSTSMPAEGVGGGFVSGDVLHEHV